MLIELRFAVSAGPTIPRSYTRMEVHHVVTGREISEKAVSQAIELSETKYCSVAATRPSAEIVSTFEIIEG